VTSQDWTPLDETARATVEHNVNHVQVEALRQLVPDSGAYLNEVCLFSSIPICLKTQSLRIQANWNEPNFQQAFWGSNYERLKGIKKAVDPDDVFWCHVCVGNEGWEEIGDYLCRV
jgi:hypothetical protein